uniref:Uncharacterized protein n=1 Tax=Peronospora matthiolae TaxID=2874970 RepID=A0AAV1TRT7_9STRA
MTNNPSAEKLLDAPYGSSFIRLRIVCVFELDVVHVDMQTTNNDW